SDRLREHHPNDINYAGASRITRVQEPGSRPMEAAQRWPDILSLSLHPGVARTDINRDTSLRLFFRYAPFLISPEKSARRLVRLAVTPAEELTSGALYGPRHAIRPKPDIFNADYAARLWATSDAALAEPAT
ncbi:hypothetical protein ACWDMR_34040, partial [Streptomyces althioticus]